MLYGFFQSSRKQYLTLKKFLDAFGFVQSKADPTLYVWTRDESYIMIVVFVVEVLMSGESNKSLHLEINYFK